MNVLGIDGGASSTKWVVMNDKGICVAEGQSDPLTGHLLEMKTRSQAFDALEKIVRQATHYDPAAVVAGVSGLDAGSVEAEQVHVYLQGTLRMAYTQVEVYNDMDLNYRANFAPGAGIVVYAGTGSVAYHIAQNGSVVRAGGHGYLIGDEGGGFWIGKTALRQVVRWRDEGSDDLQRPLARLLYEQIGGSDWSGVRAYVYGGGRQAVAALAPSVGQAALAGDEAAKTILLEAGLELASLAQTLLRRLGQLPVVLCGGALRISPLIQQSAQSQVEMTLSSASSAETAARMALEGVRG
ncbi:MAG: ATPase [Thermaceae bacterium]|nr:ATPase [Thermaceae bacterium]